MIPDFDDFADAVHRYVRDLAARENAANAKTFDRWLVNGMKGRLVKRDGIVSIEPCDPKHDGELRIIDYGRSGTLRLE